MSHRKMHGEYVRPDPSNVATHLMHTKGSKPVCEDLPKRSSPRTGRVINVERMHLHALPGGFRSRITLPSIWEKAK